MSLRPSSFAQPRYGSAGDGGGGDPSDDVMTYGGGRAPAPGAAGRMRIMMTSDDNNDDDDNPMVLSDEDEDDNMNADIDSDNDEASSLGQPAGAAGAASEDPLKLAIDDLEGRVISALDDVKLHPGIKTSQDPSGSVHDELATLLRPVLEVAAHTGPSVARTYSTHGPNDLEALEDSVEDVYQRIISDLVLPVLLEMAQSDLSPTKRVAALEFFRGLYRECHKAGSWLDVTGGGAGTSLQAGPYGSGVTSSSSASAAGLAASASSASLAATPAGKSSLKRRQAKRLHRDGEILRYWVEASIACTTPGAFTNEASEGTVASRGVVAASASLRPGLAHIATRIKDADDRGATRLYNPVMKMLNGVVRKLFVGATSSGASAPGESIVSACVKFLEIVCLCCSRRPPQEGLAAGRRRAGAAGGPGGGGGGTGAMMSEDFALDDLPPGHQSITRESLEAISEYSFTVLRGMALLGGQVKVDANLLQDAMSASGTSTTTSQVIAVLKPAALSYLEIETTSIGSSGGGEKDTKAVLQYTIDRTRIDYEFHLSQKSFALAVNALSALAVNRPVYFKEASVCLARRAVQPPAESHFLSRPAVLALTAQLKGSCLTLLRNSLSIATQCWEVLHQALLFFGMSVQADKALAMARQATALKTAGRAARNRANMYYEWDATDQDEGDRLTKRQRETDDALARMRAAKAARGLGHGIQLPINMTQAVELVLVNLPNLPDTRPADGAGGATSGKGESASQGPAVITLDSLIDAIMSSGATLTQKEGRWYERDGGTAWTLDHSQKDLTVYQLSSNMLDTIHGVVDKNSGGEKQGREDDALVKRRKIYLEQCQTAAGEAVGRILFSSTYSRFKSVANLGNQVAARLAFTLGKVHTPLPSLDMVLESVRSCSNVLGDEQAKRLEQFVDAYPVVASSLAIDASVNAPGQGDPADADHSITLCLLNEALLQPSEANADDDTYKYDQCLDIWVSTVVRAGRLANDKPTDADRRHVAARSAATLQRSIVKLPRLTKSSLLLIASMCDIEDITKRAADASRKTSQDSIAASAAAHAAKVAAEKRATAALLILRDTAFQRSNEEARRDAVECAVAVASGRFSSTPSVVDKALKLCMNVLYAKADSLAEMVVECATSELEFYSEKAVEAFPAIDQANKESTKDEHQKKNPLIPQSDEEKTYMDMMRKPAVLFMALCIRRPDIIETLFRLSSIEHANVLAKAVRSNMSKLARAAAAKYGAADIAMRVASMTSTKETPLLLSFLECLAPGSEKSGTEDDIVEACFKIQDSKADENGKKDPRFIIPVVSVMKRKDLIRVLPEFVAAEDKIFLAALVRMGDRHQRQALLFRDEPDEENPTLHGMTLCEQLVFLHRIDFTAAGLPQKQYLSAIRLCLEDAEVYNDRVVMSALDIMSGVFLANEVPLPLAFMRTVILTCTKHESLRSWICHVLLPRLVEGKIYEDARQWEGWMRCANMIEQTGDPNVSTVEAIQKLPPEQQMQYKMKWAGK